MTSRPIYDHIIAEMRAEIRALRKDLQRVKNNQIVTLPQRTATNLPAEAGDGELALGDDGVVYVHYAGNWVPVTAGGIINAAAITFDPTGMIVATGNDVQEVIGQLDTRIDHLLPKPTGYSEIDFNTIGDHIIGSNPNTGLKIQLISYYLIADDAISVFFCSDNGGSSISGTKALQQGTGWVAPLGYWEMTNTNDDLVLNLSVSGVRVNGWAAWRLTADGFD